MTTLQIRGVQFLSRDCIPDTFRAGRDYLINEPRIRVEIKKENNQGQITITSPWPENPSIGAFEYVDPYGTKRWPIFLKMSGTLELSENGLLTRDSITDQLRRLRNILWASFKTCPSLKVLTDQTVTKIGYRRSFFSEMGDFHRNPRQADIESYITTALEEPTGPGFTCIEGFRLRDEILFFPEMYLQWSQAFSLPNPPNPSQDLEKIRKCVKRIKLHRNSFRKIQEAEESLKQKNTITVILTTATAVETALKYYCGEWGHSYPTKGGLKFHNKIEQVLIMANKPSYRSINQTGLQEIGRLYKARNNESHEGECYFKDSETGTEVRVTLTHCKVMFDEALKFLLWLDALT